MKTNRYHLAASVLLAAALPALPAAEENKPVREERKELRVIAGPEREHRVIIRDGERRERQEMEKVPYLGVVASPVTPALSSQLALPSGTGLVIGQVAPKSPAMGVLQEHDILLKLDDQILIEARQLSVLVRNHKEGDEVTLTYLRGGQKATAKVKLGSHEVPKLSAAGPVGVQTYGFSFGAPEGEFDGTAPGPEAQRAHVDRLLSMMRRPSGGPEGGGGGAMPSGRVFIDRMEGGRPGVRAMALDPSMGSIVFSDHEGALELTTKDGGKFLVAKDPKGEQIYSGPVSTPEERGRLPANLRARLERLEGMRDVTFKTDGDFRGAETKVVRPMGRSISVPRAPVVPARPPGEI